MEAISKAISQLATERKEKIHKADVYSTTFAPPERNQVVQLIGENCIIHCQMNGIKSKVLLDTGEEVSLKSKAWLNTRLNEHKVSKIEKILDPCDKLRIRSENQVEIRFFSWVDITFELTDHGDEES